MHIRLLHLVEVPLKRNFPLGTRKLSDAGQLKTFHSVLGICIHYRARLIMNNFLAFQTMKTYNYSKWKFIKIAEHKKVCQVCSTARCSRFRRARKIILIRISHGSEAADINVSSKRFWATEKVNLMMLNFLNLRAANLSSKQSLSRAFSIAFLWSSFSWNHEFPIGWQHSMMRIVVVRVCESQSQRISNQEGNDKAEQEIIMKHVCVWFHSDEFDNLSRSCSPVS